MAPRNARGKEYVDYGDANISWHGKMRAATLVCVWCGGLCLTEPQSQRYYLPEGVAYGEG